MTFEMFAWLVGMWFIGGIFYAFIGMQISIMKRCSRKLYLMVKDELDYWYADACRRYMKKVIRTDTIIILIVSFLVLQFIPLIGAIGFFAGFFLKWLFNKGAAGPNDQNIAETIAIFVRFAKTGKEEDFKEILIQAAWKLKNESLYKHI